MERRQVAQPAILRPTPHRFVGVQVWHIRWEIFRHDVWVGGQERLDQPRLAVDTVSVPHDCEQAMQLLSQFLQEGYYLFRMHRFIERHEFKVQARMAYQGTQGDATDGRELVAPIEALQHRCFSPRRQGAAYRRGQGEAGFVEEDDVGLPFPRLAKDTRQLIVYPAFHLLVVAFAGLALGFLAGPMQAFLEDLADVFGVVVDAEVFADQAGDPVGGPEFVMPAMTLSSLQQELFQVGQLGSGQAWRSTGQGSGVQTVRLSGHASPTMDGRGADAKNAGDDRWRLAMVDEFYRAATPAFEFSSSTFGSHIVLYARAAAKDGFSTAGLSKMPKPPEQLTMCRPSG